MALTDLFQFISLGVLVLAVSSNFSARLLLEDSAGPAPADPLVCGAHAYWAYLPCFVPILSYLFLLKALYTYNYLHRSKTSAMFILRPWFPDVS